MTRMKSAATVTKKKTPKPAARPAVIPATTIIHPPPAGSDPALLIRAIDAAGAHGAQFKTGQLREALGLRSGSQEAYVFHRFFKALVKNGIVQPVDPARRRNRSFTVADHDRLAAAASDATLNAAPKRARYRRGACPQRLVRLELQMSKVVQLQTDLLRRIRQIERDWK